MRTFSLLAVVAVVGAFAASEQDTEMWGIVPVTQPKYASCYGQAAEWQLRRAIEARAAQFVEPPAQTITRAHGDLRNLPVLPPGHPATLYRTWWARRGKAPFRPADEVARSSRPAGNFECLKTMYESWQGTRAIVAPTCAVLCAANDAMRRSYSLPPFGVVVFDLSAIAEEYAHFFNWSPPGADATGFSAPPLNHIASWGEFKAAFRGLKLDAWRMGHDVGTPGGMARYVADLAGGGLAAFTNRVPGNAVKLLDAYIEASEAVGTSEDNADYERLRAWMASDLIGRMVL